MRVGAFLSGFGKCSPGLMPGGDRRSTSLHPHHPNLARKHSQLAFSQSFMSQTQQREGREGDRVSLKIHQMSFFIKVFGFGSKQIQLCTAIKQCMHRGYSEGGGSPKNKFCHLLSFASNISEFLASIGQDILKQDGNL